MRTLSLTLFLIPGLGAVQVAHAQGGDKEYLSAVMAPATKRTATYYRVPAGRDGAHYVGRTHAMDGTLKAEGHYLDERLTIEDGEFIFYHPNGEVESRGLFTSGHKTGVWERFDAAGRRLAEKVYDPAAMADMIHGKVQEMPRYRGGDERELQRFVAERVRMNVQRKVKGKAVMNFVVEKDGSLTHVGVADSLGPLVDEQLTEAIRSTAPWVPGSDKGMPVRVRMRIPIQF